MKPEADDLQKARQAYLQSTRLEGLAERKLRARILCALPEPGANDVPRERSWAAWLGGSLLFTAAVAALSLLALRLGQAPQDTRLTRLSSDDVSLSFAGEGRIGGTEKAPVIDWESGQLSVAVTPDRHVDLTVSTPEATVRVVGTVFTVDRADQATTVAVQRGTVRVTCVGEGEVAVTGGGSLTCQPRDLEARVQRAVALSQRRAPASERLAAIDAALALAGGSDELVAELLAHRVRALDDAGRTDEALADAERALSVPGSARQAELAEYVAATRFARQACDARTALEEAVRLDPGTPQGLLLATCLREEDPERARALLEASSGRARGELAELALRLKEQLGQKRP